MAKGQVSTNPSFDPEMEKHYNEIAKVFAEGFIARIYSDGIVQDITAEKLLDYLSDPDNYIREMANVAMYYYISNGEVFQLFDLAKVLPTLNYKIEVLDKNKNYEKNLAKCNKILRKVKHKQLTRDIITQLISQGTLTGIWLGNINSPYLYIFDDVQKFFPDYRINGEWVVTADLSFLNDLNEKQREVFFKNLSPYITKSHYEAYKNDPDKYRYVELPQNRTVCLRTHTLKRSQRYGINWSTTGLYDLVHKKKLKDLEKAIANKIITSIAVLTIGNKENPEQFGNLKLSKDIKKKIFSNVKAALEKNLSKGISVISIPEFASLEFPELKTDALEPEKFNSINSDITGAYGISTGLTNGLGSNYAAGKLVLEIFYRRLAVLLEDIESEVYDKLFAIILPKSVADDYHLVYEKEVPLTLKEKVDILMKLNSSFGFSLKAVIDCLSGIDFDEYLNQTIYEQEELQIPLRVRPYSLAYTSTGSDEGGRKPIDNPDNPNTIKSKTSDLNNNPN